MVMGDFALKKIYLDSVAVCFIKDFDIRKQ